MDLKLPIIHCGERYLWFTPALVLKGGIFLSAEKSSKNNFVGRILVNNKWVNYTYNIVSRNIIINNPSKNDNISYLKNVVNDFIKEVKAFYVKFNK